MTKIYSGMPQLNGHLVAAIDFETTGARAGYHEPIQIAVVPLNSDLRPLEDVRPFYTNIRPLHPERAEQAAMRVNKLDLNDLCLHATKPDRVADLFIEWFERLDLPFKRVIVPLAHNWSFEAGFLREWLGVELSDRLFHAHARDAMSYAVSLNDKSFFMGEKAPFNQVSLSALSRHFGVLNARPHDALCDALAEAEVYRHLLLMDVL